ncbi:maintenance of telomere capping protein 1 [Dipodascopsis tothii]|uniref:maintenance of telomere capping protein 1 n=1 Tax=Dipodascopsis tothii TaxID=44089 RepID=UPI0034CDEB96
MEALNKLGLSHKLASTFSSVLSTIAPPILRHEQLRIHIFHDIVGYPSVDSIVYSVFDRVIQQVEGGELIIVQKGVESHRRGSDKGAPRDLNVFTGGIEAAEKLAKANAEEAIGKGKDAEQAADSPIRKSDIFLSLQPAAIPCPSRAESGDLDGGAEFFTFVVYLNDPAHSLTFVTHSQSFPLKWATWLDTDEYIPGQVDPREWLAEWVEEGLGLAIGVVAQRYVASRMAVGVDLSPEALAEAATQSQSQSQS